MGRDRSAATSAELEGAEVIDLPVPDSEIVAGFSTDSGYGVAVVSPAASCDGEGDVSRLVSVDARPTRVLGDADLMAVLLRNLIENAVRYGRPTASG